MPAELDKIYDRFGWYGEETISITKTGMDGAKQIAKIMEVLREKEIKEILGRKVLTLNDFKKQIEIDYANPNK